MLPYVASGGLGPSSVPVDVTCNRLNQCQDWIICFQGRVGQGIEWNMNTLEGFTVRNLLLKSAKIWDKSFFRPSVTVMPKNQCQYSFTVSVHQGAGTHFPSPGIDLFCEVHDSDTSSASTIRTSPWCGGRVVFTGKEATRIWGLHPSLTFLGLSVLKEEFILRVRVRPHYVHVFVHDNHLANVQESLNLS